MGWHHWYGWWWFWVFWVVFIGLIIWLFVRPTPGRTRVGDLEDTPENILKRRYARGEIDKAEYDRRLSDINRKAS